MLNGLWKAAYDLSMIAPVLAIIPLLDQNFGLLGCLMIVSGLFLLLLGMLLPLLSRKYLTSEPLIVESVYPNDSFYEYVFSYTLPILPTLAGFDLVASFVVICIIGALVVMSNRSVPNPFLRIIGYHFYTVDIRDGFKGYTLINKGKLQSTNELDRGYFASQFLIIGVDCREFRNFDCGSDKETEGEDEDSGWEKDFD
ncbi:MAG: hypothetical protein IKN41_03350 [Candidatus Methanomethylophilaceae archaeon]|nr:hypothetical protein [Candidatus Methanomethylophilaceae archaeon]